mmetsp:Transcript_132904/g.425365  ORF Transcript_132904/g.425365 Transcript_132904/m.425365 type:complete len:636 (+) Transcript_132904:135-2042(+)
MEQGHAEKEAKVSCASGEQRYAARGVCWHKSSAKWQVVVNRVYLGRFEKKEEAVAMSIDYCAKHGIDAGPLPRGRPGYSPKALRRPVKRERAAADRAETVVKKEAATEMPVRRCSRLQDTALAGTAGAAPARWATMRGRKVKKKRLTDGSMSNKVQYVHKHPEREQYQVRVRSQYVGNFKTLEEGMIARDRFLEQHPDLAEGPPRKKVKREIPGEAAPRPARTSKDPYRWTPRMTLSTKTPADEAKSDIKELSSFAGKDFGVTRHVSGTGVRWVAKYRNIYLGCFKTKDEARMAVQEAGIQCLEEEGLKLKQKGDLLKAMLKVTSVRVAVTSEKVANPKQTKRELGSPKKALFGKREPTENTAEAPFVKREPIESTAEAIRRPAAAEAQSPPKKKPPRRIRSKGPHADEEREPQNDEDGGEQEGGRAGLIGAPGGDRDEGEREDAFLQRLLQKSADHPSAQAADEDLPFGVMLLPATSRYMARLRGKYLGTFGSPEEASQKIAEAARQSGGKMIRMIVGIKQLKNLEAWQVGYSGCYVGRFPNKAEAVSALIQTAASMGDSRPLDAWRYLEPIDLPIEAMSVLLPWDSPHLIATAVVDDPQVLVCEKRGGGAAGSRRRPAWRARRRNGSRPTLLP